MMHLLFSLFLIIFLAGCATVPYTPSGLDTATVPGIYHEVKRGDTLWDIARDYGMELETVIKANRLPDASKIEVGQLIFIPEGRDQGPDRSYKKDKTRAGFIWPIKGIVTSYFGSTKDMAKNKGIDIQTQAQASIVASRSGKVVFASEHLKGYGKTIIIDHLDGFETVYAHNSQNLVRLDQRIKQGEVIARAGQTGRVNKPTLHFEVRRKHKPQNPFYYLP